MFNRKEAVKKFGKILKYTLNCWCLVLTLENWVCVNSALNSPVERRLSCPVIKTFILRENVRLGAARQPLGTKPRISLCFYVMALQNVAQENVHQKLTFALQKWECPLACSFPSSKSSCFSTIPRLAVQVPASFAFYVRELQAQTLCCATSSSSLCPRLPTKLARCDPVHFAALAGPAGPAAPLETAFVCLVLF